MATTNFDTWISNLTAATSIGATDLIPVIQGGNTKKVTPPVLQSFLNLSIGIDARTYGVVAGSGSDQAPAINNAINAANSPGSGYMYGGVVLLPPGQINIATPVTLKNRVRLIGAGKKSTALTALSGFTGSYMVNLDDGTDLSFDSTIERMTIDTQNIAGLSCLLSTQIQEGCGGKSLMLIAADTYGVHLTSNSANFLWEDLEIYTSSTNAIAGFMSDSGIAGSNLIQRVTIGGSKIFTDGIVLTTGTFSVNALHLEECTNGLHVYNGAAGVVNGTNGATGTTTVIKCEGVYWSFLATVKGPATNTIVDTIATNTNTNNYIQYYTPREGMYIGATAL
jgi:pectate lyase-like protein